jgi:hypothetical protein
MSSAGYHRIEALQRFGDIRRRAQICQLCKKIAKRPLTLLPFTPIHGRLPNPNGINRDLQEIPVAQIVGSLDRHTEFDRLFRPLRNSQRERWVNMWVMHMQSGWDPILVHQIGNLYFVEDGHHRTSVARASGLASIAAKVTEYPVSLHFDPLSPLTAILAQLDAIPVDNLVPVAAGVHPLVGNS